MWAARPLEGCWRANACAPLRYEELPRFVSWAPEAHLDELADRLGAA
jgi:hypothetical protein